MSKWRVKLICCGRDDGEWIADTYEEADKFREQYTSGAGVNPHGFDPNHAHKSGHQRAGIISEVTQPPTDQQDFKLTEQAKHESKVAEDYVVDPGQYGADDGQQGAKDE